MTHRAQQIIDAVAALVRARVEPSGVKVFTHRRLSLDPEQDELPAISVDYGDLTVDDKDPEEDYFDCTLAVMTTAVAVNAEESLLRNQLLAMTVEAQAAINAVPLLGLNFVNDTILIGWATPEVGQTDEFLAGSLTSSWQIKFRMQFEDAAATGSVPNL